MARICCVMRRHVMERNMPNCRGRGQCAATTRDGRTYTTPEIARPSSAINVRIAAVMAAAFFFFSGIHVRIPCQNLKMAVASVESHTAPAGAVRTSHRRLAQQEAAERRD